MAGKKTLDNLTALQIKASELAVQVFAEGLVAFVQKNLAKLLARVAGGGVSAAETATLLAGAMQALKDAGLDAEVSKLEDLFGDELDQVRHAFEEATGQALALTEFDVRDIQALANTEVLAASGLVSKYLGDVRTLAVQSAFLGRGIDVSEIADALGDRLAAQLQTELNTSLQGMNRLVNLTKATDAGIDTFLYEGPDDKVTRPFCHARVGKVWTKAQIDTWDNGTDLPAPIFCGGYNCRHRLLAVSQALIDRLGLEMGGEAAD